jgi:hypothetical protein
MNTLAAGAGARFVRAPHSLPAGRACAAAPPPPPPRRAPVGGVPLRLAASWPHRGAAPRTCARAARGVAAAALTEQELAKRALRLDTFEPQAVDQVSGKRGGPGRRQARSDARATATTASAGCTHCGL